MIRAGFALGQGLTMVDWLRRSAYTNKYGHTHKYTQNAHLHILHILIHIHTDFDAIHHILQCINRSACSGDR